MKLVIDIDEEEYKAIVEKYDTFPAQMKEWGLSAIKNSTPLPKGHGKIGDLDRLYQVFERNVVGADAFKQLFDMADTIIPADIDREREDYEYESRY